MTSEQVLVALRRAVFVPGEARDRFTELFCAWCGVFGFAETSGDELEVAKLFDTSRPVVRHWRNGSVVPPAARLILQLALEQLEILERKKRGIR